MLNHLQPIPFSSRCVNPTMIFITAYNIYHENSWVFLQTVVLAPGMFPWHSKYGFFIIFPMQTRYGATENE